MQAVLQGNAGLCDSYPGDSEEETLEEFSLANGRLKSCGTIAKDSNSFKLEGEGIIPASSFSPLGSACQVQ